MEWNWFFLMALPVVAFLYASVGHGGASGYLALMALFGFSTLVMKPSALMLNLFVSAIAFYYFRKHGYYRAKLFYPFALTSIPMAFVGGMLNVDPKLYKQILGVLLVFAVLRLLGLFGKATKRRPVDGKLALLIGAAIGLFSGMIGIGGGIILSPVILLLGWADLKETAAVSALFIWVNSAAALAGLLSAGVAVPQQVYPYVLVALIGGAAGGYYGSKKLNLKLLRVLLAFVLIIASVKLLLV